MDFLDKRVNENDFEYKVRLCNAKLNKQIDLDWIELVEKLGLNCSSDHLRKLSYAYKEFSDYLDENKLSDITDLDILNEIELKNLELKKEKIKLCDQRRELNKLIREEARWENFRDEIIENVKELNNNYPLLYNSDYRGYDVGSHNREGLLLLSDIHYGIEIKNLLNVYNPSVARERFKKLTSRTLEYCELNKVSKLNILLQGDLLSGIIHNNLRLQNAEDIISQVINLSEILAQLITELGSHIPYIDVHYTYGNHGRVHANKHDAIESENFEHLIIWHLETRLSNLNNIRILKSKFDEIVHMNICGYDILSVHGQNDRLNTVIHDLTKITRIIPYMICFAHLHKDFRNEDGTTIVVNGSFSGIDEYALAKRYVSIPHQKLIIFEENFGEIATYKISF